MSKKQPEIPAIAAVGASGLKRFGGYVQDEWHQDLVASSNEIGRQSAHRRLLAEVLLARHDVNGALGVVEPLPDDDPGKLVTRALAAFLSDWEKTGQKIL